ncbi:hypothetical protein Droror1_Dr00012304, partial [Drosera rotundifolia]
MEDSSTRTPKPSTTRTTRSRTLSSSEMEMEFFFGEVGQIGGYGDEFSSTRTVTQTKEDGSEILEAVEVVEGGELALQKALGGAVRMMGCLSPHLGIWLEYNGGKGDNSIHLQGQQLTTFKGNYDVFVRTREEQLKNQQKAFEANERTRSHMQAFIDKFWYNAKRASLVQSRIK